MKLLLTGSKIFAVFGIADLMLHHSGRLRGSVFIAGNGSKVKDILMIIFADFGRADLTDWCQFWSDF